jgi:hypothetical protein
LTEKLEIAGGLSDNSKGTHLTYFTLPGTAIFGLNVKHGRKSLEVPAEIIHLAVPKMLMAHCVDVFKRDVCDVNATSQYKVGKEIIVDLAPRFG